VERLCQDRGVRLVRCHCPDSAIFEDYFARLGYLPIGRDFSESGEPQLLLERRLPLLTVREQRRGDADAIGALTRDDPWVFAQGSRPGAFVAADGEKVVGFIQCAEAARGIARIGVPALAAPYRGRGLELWMISRAVEYAETNGYHTAEMEAVPELDSLRKGLEERFWVRERDTWRRVFFTPRDEAKDDW
jgi:GNAT superfamily N-acetyltransferase